MGEGTFTSSFEVPDEFLQWFETVPKDIRCRMSMHQLRWFWEQDRKARKALGAAIDAWQWEANQGDGIDQKHTEVFDEALRLLGREVKPWVFPEQQAEPAGGAKE